jgi:PAS domain S-box-containing protein
MSIIQFKEANCKNCYKCIRSCPVKAIAFVNDQARIVEEDCMLCGNCLTVCPQNAKIVKSDIDVVKGFISKKEKVYASLAPSFISAFENADERWLYAALKKLGFTYVEETAIGAAKVSEEYDRLINEKKMKNIITTACPSITLLVQKYYPELVDQLAPVVSPMIAHGKMLRATYGSRIKVVFIGPCLSKKNECNELQSSGVIDAALTFEELDKWLTDEGIRDMDLAEEISGEKELKSRIYPVHGGIIKTLKNKNRHYKSVSIDGVDKCIKILDSLKTGELKNYFIEMNSCSGGCIGGPCMKHISGGFLEARSRVIDYLRRGMKKEQLLKTCDVKVDMRKRFFNLSRKTVIPPESAIRDILISTGKFDSTRELNCGACGYSSCREKAIAVYNNRAQLHMCLPFMRERAESMSNLIINATPNAIFALDSKLSIQEANFAAQKAFGLNEAGLVGKNIFDVLPSADFKNVIDSGKNIYDKKCYYEKYYMTVKQSIIYVPEQNIVVVVIKDITEEENQMMKLHRIQEENVELAQDVIDKQMRVAQEIASLLGETTAETKMALTKIKKSIMSEMGAEK